MKRTLKTALLITCLISLLIACFPGNGSAESLPEAVASSDQSGFKWQISLIKAEVTDSLANVQTFVLYGGSKQDVAYEKKAAPGKTFLLLEMNINKNGVGGKAFSWEDVYVEDAQGNRYKRHENDTFLEDYDLKRLKSTKLTIGNNTGCVCFEIPADTPLPGLKLVHEANEGSNIIALPLQ